MKNTRSYILFMFVLLLTYPLNAEWYKGNTHMHSIRSDGDSPLEQTVGWYAEHGYDFVVLTDHNITLDETFLNVEQLPKPIMIISGNEISYGSAHCTALGLDRQIVASNLFNDWRKTDKVYQIEVNAINAAGALPIINHPNFSDGISEQDLSKIKGCHHIELFNGHPLVYNWGNEKHIPVEEKWDYILSAGLKVYGIASDDSHRLKTTKKAYPGKGWIMVNASRLTEKAIIAAIKSGEFYASTGVQLSGCRRDKNCIRVVVDENSTLENINSGLGAYVERHTGVEGYKLEVISNGGEVIHTTNEKDLCYHYDMIDRYLRVRVSYTVQKDGKYRTYYAWTQPVFSKYSRNLNFR